MNKTIIALLCATGLAGAAAAAEQVTMTYEPQTADTTPQKLVSGCTVAIAAVQDGRNNRETIGHEWTPIVASDPRPWLMAAFGRLKDYGYDVVQAEQPPSGAIGVSPTLIRAYTFHGPMRINGMVAVDAKVTLPSGQTEQRKIRASGSKTNMAGMTGEYMTTLNYAVNNLVDKLALELQPLCSSAALAQKTNP